MDEFLLKAEHINAAVEGVSILRQVDFALRAGEFVGLIGANGAGKSTLLKVLGGLWREEMSGAIMLCGRALTRYGARELARMIAYVPQSTWVDFAFTAREVALMGRNPHVGRFQMESAHDRAVAEEALVTADAQHLADRTVYTLSGGEGQRVVIARALAQQAQIMLLDEPTSNLDVRHQLDLLALAREQAHTHGLGVVAAVHDLGMAARFCDRLALLHEGGVIADGEPEAVLTPEQLRTAFEIDGRLYRDPYTDALTLSVG